QNIIDYCNAWYDEVLCGGYTPGIYVGFDNFLTSEDLYWKLKFKHYWKSFSRVPDVYKRGYEMVQLEWKTVNGIQLDTDEVTGDRLGNKPIFMEAEQTDWEKKYYETVSEYNQMRDRHNALVSGINKLVKEYGLD